MGNTVTVKSDIYSTGGEQAPPSPPPPSTAAACWGTRLTSLARCAAVVLWEIATQGEPGLCAARGCAGCSVSGVGALSLPLPRRAPFPWPEQGHRASPPPPSASRAGCGGAHLSCWLPARVAGAMPWLRAAAPGCPGLTLPAAAQDPHPCCAGAQRTARRRSQTW